jgi:hypothetical protein
MKRLALILTATVLLALSTGSAAQAAFGFKDFDLVFTNADGSPVTQAGSHPFAVTNTLLLNTVMDPKYGELPEEALRDIVVQLPAGLVGSPGAVPRCASSDFLDREPAEDLPGCSDDSAVGVFDARLNYGSDANGPIPTGQHYKAAVFNLVPASTSRRCPRRLNSGSTPSLPITSLSAVKVFLNFCPFSTRS